MSLEVEVLKYVKVEAQDSGAPSLTFLIDPLPDLIAKEVETALAAYPAIPPDAPVHEKFKLYQPKVASAFNDAILSLAQKGMLAPWDLDMAAALPSVDKGNGVWEYREGISVRMTKATTGFTVGPPLGVGIEYYLSVHPPMSREDDAKECTFCFPNDTGLGATGIVLFVAQTRTEILSIEQLGSNSTSRKLSRSTDTVWDVRWRGEKDGEVCFKVRFLGDPPFFRAHTWISTRAPLGHAPAIGPFEEPPPAISPRHVNLLDGFERTFQEELAHRAELIEKQGTEVDAKRFFLELDETTSPQGLPPEKALPIAMLGSYLALRYNVRAELVHFGEPTLYLPAELSSWEERVKPIAHHLQSLLRSHFPGEENGIDKRAVNDAFEKFAGGELRVFEAHGAPDGVNYFAFAELAILLSEMNLDKEFWEPLIEVFGRTAEIYAGSFHACHAGRTHCAYQISNNLDGGRHPDGATKADLRKKWAGKDATAELDRVVHSALFDDQLPGPTPYAELEDWGCEAWT